MANEADPIVEGRLAPAQSVSFGLAPTKHQHLTRLAAADNNQS